MLSIQKKEITLIVNSLIIISIIVVIVGIIIDLLNTFKYGGIDLRNRIVGSRLLIEGLDPYFFQWNSNLSPRLLDPLNDSSFTRTRVTVTPAVLFLYCSIAKLSYLKIRIIWLIVQWLFLLTTILIFVKLSSSKLQAKLVIILGLLFFSGSLFWRIHIERGQTYILYTFLLAVSYFLLKQSFKYRQILSGIFLGFTITTRLPIILVLLPFLIYRKLSFITGAIVGIILSITVSWPVCNLKIWQSYLKSMLGITQFFAKYQTPDVAVFKQKANNIYPKVIEGMNNLKRYSNLEQVDSSLNKIRYFFGVDIPLLVFVCTWLLILAVLLYFISIKHKSSISGGLLFWFGVYLYIITEFFIPAARYSYNDIQFLIPLSILAIEFQPKQLIGKSYSYLLFLGLFIALGTFNWIPNLLLFSVYTIVAYLTIIFFMTYKLHPTKG